MLLIFGSTFTGTQPPVATERTVAVLPQLLDIIDSSPQFLEVISSYESFGEDSTTVDDSVITFDDAGALFGGQDILGPDKPELWDVVDSTPRLLEII